MPQFQFDRTTALNIADDLIPLGVNVTLVIIGDSQFHQGDDPVYQIELSRNANLNASKVAEIASALEPHETTLEFPSMSVVSTKPDPEPEPPLPDPSGGGAVADESTGALAEPPQAQPAE